MDSKNLAILIADGQNRILKTTGIARPDYEQFLLNAAGSKPIKIVSGLRRSGKSFLLRRVIKQLVNSGKYSIDNVLYLNFEDYRLEACRSADELHSILKYFLSNSTGCGPKTLVFDEIQLVENWNKFIRNIYDAEEAYEIFITGSNSDLLSTEFASKLAGRHIDLQIQSFSLLEILRYQGLEIENLKAVFKYEQLINTAFETYYRYGGLAESFALIDPQAKRSYLESLISKVLLDDVIIRFSVRNTIAVEKILKFILANSGAVVSYQRIYNHIKSMGITIDLETVMLYSDYLQKAFAYYEVLKFNWKDSKIFSTSKKYYASDLGLATLYRDPTENFSRVIENLVYLKLRREHRFSNIYYGKDENDKEIDFVVVDSREHKILYQVSLEIGLQNQNRELNPLINSDKYLQGAEKYLLLLNSKDKDLTDGIKQKDLIPWILGI